MKTSSATPFSRQTNDINDSCEPFSTATRQALFHSSNWSGVTAATWAKKSLSETKAISHLLIGPFTPMLNNHNRKKLRKFWSGTEDTEILSPRTMRIFSPDTTL